jgi:alpha-aminoadipic semialdehyde synthase
VDVAELARDRDVRFIVQPSDNRVFTNEEYEQAGALVSEDLSPCSVILAVKEIPPDLIQPEKTYVFFSHVIKGQAHNMPMLAQLMESRCNLIDYEKMEDETGQRLVFFGRFAGAAGMVDTLWALGQRLHWEGFETPLYHLMPSHHYGRIDRAKSVLRDIGNQIAAEPIPVPCPILIGIAGYGHVSMGAQEILDCLPCEEIRPDQIKHVVSKSNLCDRFFKVVFREEDLVEPRDSARDFDLQDYYEHPERYRSVFERYWHDLTALVNAIYWDQRYPRLITKKQLHDGMTGTARPRLRVVGDISCDIEGSIEFTVKVTDPDEPVYVYDPFNHSAIPGIAGCGPVVMAVDNLPCEFSAEASEAFGNVLRRYIPIFAEVDFSKPLAQAGLLPELERATIVWHGELTPEFRYLHDHLATDHS